MGRKKKQAGIFRELPMLKDAQGQVLQSFAEQQEQWFRQFGAIEAAYEVHDTQLQEAHLQQAGATHVPGFDDLPTLTMVQRKLRRLRAGKAPGLDGIPNEVLKAGGSILGIMLHELILKVSIAAREPLQC